MRQKSMKSKEPAEKAVRDIRRRTRRQYSSEEKIRIVLEGLRGEESVASLCRREGISDGLYYSWSKEFLGEAQAPLVRAKRRTARNDWRVTPSARRQVMR
jgi:transposase